MRPALPTASLTRSRPAATSAAPAVLEAYGRMRRTDIASRIWTVDLLNRSLLSSAAPVQALRGLGLHILKNVGPLRRLAIREGLAPSFIAPRLMQPAAAC